MTVATSDERRVLVPSSYGCRLATHLEARPFILPHHQSGRAQNMKTRLLTGRRIPPLWTPGVKKFPYCLKTVAKSYYRVGLFPALAAKHPATLTADNNGAATPDASRTSGREGAYAARAEAEA